MIVAGALEKEAVLHPFLGNVARRLVREARCEVMLVQPDGNKTRTAPPDCFRCDYSDQGRSFEKDAAVRCGGIMRRLYVIRIITTFDQARESIRVNARRDEKPRAEDEEARWRNSFLSAGATTYPIEARCIPRKHGLAASDFVQSVKADLLVVPGCRKVPKRQQCE